MERIYTWIHENYMKRLEKIAKKKGESKYKVAQQLIEKGLDEQQAHEVSITIAYYFLIYSIIIATLLFVF